MRNTPPHDWQPFLADERPLRRFSPHARHRLALGYANSYHVGMSSLGFQRTFELVHERPDVYLVTPHYESHPMVLVRLAAADPDEVRELLLEAWLERAPKRVAAAWQAEHT